MLSRLIISITEYFDGEIGKRRLNRVLIVAIISVLLLMFLLTAEEQTLFDSPEMQLIADNGVLHVGIRENVPGFSLNGEGLDIELAYALSDTIFEGKSSELTLSLVPVSTYSAETMLQDGSIDVAIAQMPLGDDSGHIYSTPYYNDDIVIASCKDIDKEPKDQFLGCIQNTNAESALKALSVDEEGNTLMEYKLFASYSDLLNALERGTIEGAVINRAVFRIYQNEYSLLSDPTVISAVDYCIVVSSEAPALAQIANIMLYDLKESGELDAIIQKYGL
ncbi:MAG: transporter substrate-binding domain-containing protein [Clostridia bacterium]|nr:transporter substrate-binding domain-containing protein [Clostridia bacterium]